MIHGPMIWQEDDCTIHDPDHEFIEGAWRRLFGVELKKEDALEIEDAGDAILWRMPNGAIALHSWPGGSEIYSAYISPGYFPKKR